MTIASTDSWSSYQMMSGTPVNSFARASVSHTQGRISPNQTYLWPDMCLMVCLIIEAVIKLHSVIVCRAQSKQLHSRSLSPSLCLSVSLSFIYLIIYFSHTLSLASPLFLSLTQFLFSIYSCFSLSLLYT